MHVRLLMAGLVAFFALLSEVASALGMGKLQFLYTAFLDVDTAFNRALGECERVAPHTKDTLLALHRDWKQTHGPFQEPFRARVIAELNKRMTPEQTNEMVQQFTSVANTRIVEMNFPFQSVRPFDCENLLPTVLRSESIMLRFKDYVERWDPVTWQMK